MCHIESQFIILESPGIYGIVPPNDFGICDIDRTGVLGRLCDIGSSLVDLHPMMISGRMSEMIFRYSMQLFGLHLLSVQLQIFPAVQMDSPFPRRR
jgi:hypothetical protein